MSGLNELGWNDFNILVGKVVKEAERRGTSIFEITRDQAKREFRIGDWVKFDARGRSVIGKIIKIKHCIKHIMCCVRSPARGAAGGQERTTSRFGHGRPLLKDVETGGL